MINIYFILFSVRVDSQRDPFRTDLMKKKIDLILNKSGRFKKIMIS
jgi:hypothetical protein